MSAIGRLPPGRFPGPQATRLFLGSSPPPEAPGRLNVVESGRQEGPTSQPIKPTLIRSRLVQSRMHRICSSVRPSASGCFLPNANEPSSPTRQAISSGFMPQAVIICRAFASVVRLRGSSSNSRNGIFISVRLPRSANVRNWAKVVIPAEVTAPAGDPPPAPASGTPTGAARRRRRPRSPAASRGRSPACPPPSAARGRGRPA